VDVFGLAPFRGRSYGHGRSDAAAGAGFAPFRERRLWSSLSRRAQLPRAWKGTSLICLPRRHRGPARTLPATLGRPGAHGLRSALHAASAWCRPDAILLVFGVLDLRAMAS